MLKERDKNATREFEASVLILILMEHAQREVGRDDRDYLWSCLNPYFNGTCSKSPPRMT